MADVTRRLLDLLSLLQTRRHFTGAELVTRLGVSERTVRRDVDRLRGYGYPVESQPGPGGRYGLVAGRAVPPLMFDSDEVIAIMLALAAQARADRGSPGSLGEAMTRAYGKLDQVLPARLASTAAVLRSGLEAEPFRAPVIETVAVIRISEAIHEHRELTFRYWSGAGETQRRVQPHAQVHHLLRWYLVAWDCDRADWRTFRLDRMTEVSVGTRGFAPRALPAPAASELVTAGVKRGSRRVVVVVDAAPDEVAAMLPVEVMQLDPESDGGTRIVLHCEDWHWLVMILSHLDCAFRIEAPSDWAEAIADFAAVASRGAELRSSEP